MPKTTREAINRGNNLVMIVYMAVLAFGVLAELFIEDELLDKADDAFIILMAIIGIVWYLRGTHRYQFSWTPFILVTLVFVAKGLALANEFSDPAAVGDEFGIVPTALAAVVVSGFLLARARSLNRPIERGSVISAPIPQTGEPQEENR